MSGAKASLSLALSGLVEGSLRNEWCFFVSPNSYTMSFLNSKHPPLKKVTSLWLISYIKSQFWKDHMSPCGLLRSEAMFPYGTNCVGALRIVG